MIWSSLSMLNTAEHKRLTEHRELRKNWKNWGPYLSERAWGTVREDYSQQGIAWDYFPHDHACSRAYRWNEDGLAGISDRFQYLCFGLALWNGRDTILKERLFGLSGSEGNHGEDVKEYYYYLDSTPTHSYMKMLYKYPQHEFPYSSMVTENSRRGRNELEYELLDAGVFEDGRYFDVLVEYAKAQEDDILIQITIANRGTEPAELHLLPTLWYRNTWDWGYAAGPMGDFSQKPAMQYISVGEEIPAVRAEHAVQGVYYLYAQGADDVLFTENETNNQRLFGIANKSPYVKDAFHHYLVGRDSSAVNPNRIGTKAGVLYTRTIHPGTPEVIDLRLSNTPHQTPFADFEEILALRQAEADEFYRALQPAYLSDERKMIQRQALAGMLWSKQLYYYDVEQWLHGDPGSSPPAGRSMGRNREWQHLSNFDVISMPDKWEYPWYAAWDLAFHCIPITLVDPDFSKRQLVLITREWYMHPNGQLPSYEWSFGDVNPPVHAWGTWRVYKIDARQSGHPDRLFLESVFHKLLLNFTWWTNRKDADGNNIFQGGFLGLDNISIFDRSAALPTGGHIDQSDGTAWMAFYSLGMLRIALELAKENPVYQDLASKFYEHFLGIANAMTNCGGQGHCLWNEEDQFFYDALHLPDGSVMPLKVRSLVGLMPLLAVETLEPELLEEMPIFTRRMRWFTEQRPHLSGNMASIEVEGVGRRHIASILTRERLVSVLRYMLDPEEFLSEYGIRSLSKYHSQRPYEFKYNGQTFTIRYEPSESQSGLFGGNSNWRGPIWFPINFLLIESLQKFHHYYGDDLKVECPTGSGILMNLSEVANMLSERLIRLFLLDEHGRRPVFGGSYKFQNDSEWRDCILFYEYFHGDNGAGLGASHQTGWTGLVAKLIQQSGENA
jgi:hypothetical protein